MENRPYIGITGFTDDFRLVKACSHFESLPYAWNVDRMLMVGVLISRKTMEFNPSYAPYPERYPDVDTIGRLCNIAALDERALPILHVCGLKQHDRESKDVLRDLVRIRLYGGAHCRGIQINGGLLSSWIIKNYRTCFPDDIIIQQLPKRDVEDEEPISVARRFDGWADLINHVLIDASGGEGVLFDPFRAKALIIALSIRFPNLGIGIAGGLGPRTVGLLAPLLEQFPLLSFDAESQLMCDDGLSLTSVRTYLTKAAELLKYKPNPDDACAYYVGKPD